MSGVSLYAILSILDRVEPMMREIPGVMAAKDPECLHRMRVASRRLRMALRLLAAQSGMTDARAFFKVVRKITRALGEARDVDVQILWLEQFAQVCQAKELPGVKRIILRLSQQRDRLQPQIVKIVSGIADDAVFRKAVDELRVAKLEAEMNRSETTVHDLAHATRVITLQLDSVIQHAAALYSSDAVEAQHRMRIEVKHLRYAMEIFRGLYEENLDIYIALAKKLQSVLGDLHDADVWVERIPLLTCEERAFTAAYFGSPKSFARLAPGYDAIAADRRACRKSVYDKAISLWDDIESENQWQNLRKMLLDRYIENQGRGEATEVVVEGN